MTRISLAIGSSARCRRKYSRIERLIRFRVTAFPTLPLTVIPKRFSCCRFAHTTTTKFADCSLTPRRERFANSARFRTRAVFGNRCDALSDPTRTYVRARFGGTVTVNRLRPLARRRLMTLRPPGVSMRARKPCVRFLLILLGWYVRFIQLLLPWPLKQPNVYMNHTHRALSILVRLGFERAQHEIPYGARWLFSAIEHLGHLLHDRHIHLQPLCQNAYGAGVAHALGNGARCSGYLV
jgi:hypothetical protein